MTSLIIMFLLAVSIPAPDKSDPEPVVPGVEPVLSTIEREIESARQRGAFDIPVIVPPPPLPPVPEEPLILETDIGEATFYGGRFHGRRTASGERFDQEAMTAAHRTYPFGTVVRVTNLKNGRSVVVRINDRGPYGKPKKAARKVIDVSRGAAEYLGFIRDGRIVARVEVLEWGKAR